MEREREKNIDRCAQAYAELLDGCEIRISGEGVPEGFYLPGGRAESVRLILESDNAHYPFGTGCLYHGIGEILKWTGRRRSEDTEETAAYRRGIHTVYKAVQRLILRHAREAKRLAEQEADANRKNSLQRIAGICGRISEKRPATFEEGLQLFWFLYLARSPFGVGCIGRLDQTLYPFYCMECRAGSWNREEAMEAVLRFYRNLNRLRAGDTLRNLMLSGQDEAGKDQTNELTWIFLEAYERAGDAEPHLNVRIQENTPKSLIRACVRLLAKGKGQPTLYFDENIIPAMERAGISHADACRYANDGCTETVIDQKSGIVFWQHEMVKTVELTLFNGEENPCVVPVRMRKNSAQGPLFTPKTSLVKGFRSGAFEEMKSFEEFLNAFFRQLDFQLDQQFLRIEEKMREVETNTVTSPLVGGSFWRSAVTGKDPLRGGGFDVSNYQLLSGTITTAADSLRAVEECVFVRKWCTAAELKRALAADFQGWEALRQRLLHVPKFGNGDERTDGLAAEIGKHFIRRVNGFCGTKPLRPGLYNIDFGIFANTVGATPDGRRFRDPIGEHCCPTPGAAQKGPTAIVESASRLPMRDGYASSPLQLTLDQGGFEMGADREEILYRLMEGARRAHVPVLNLAMYDKKALRAAQKEPEKYRDLIVRVWGFNARFVELDRELQEHIIGRMGGGDNG